MNAPGFDFAAHMETVARALLGDPQDVCDDGREWRYGARGSLAVQVRGPKQGTWYDHEAGEGGNVLGLIRREKGYANGEAIDWMRGIGIDVPERRRPGRPSTADYARRLAAELRPLAGTPAEAYLREARGLSGPFAADVGFHPSVRAKAGGYHPALLCVARDGAGDGDGAVRFVHAVFLDGNRKAGFSPAKQTFGKMEGAAFRIPAADPGAGAKVVLAEGPEDALSWAEATGLETWACCGVANIGRADLPRGTDVIVAAQNDPADKEATKTLHKAVRKLRGRGFRVIVAPPPDGTKDVNDLLREAGPEAVRAALSSAQERADWRADLIYGDRGPLPVLFNAVLALSQDDQWHGVFGYDEFARRVVMRRPAPWLVDHLGAFAEREWTDLDDLRAAEWLQVRSILASHEIAGRAVQRVASDHAFHPVREWLDGLKWDGTPRLDTWLTTYLGAADTAYTRAVATRFPIGAVARIYRPGCKVDTCPILEGPQGLRKSSALRALVGDAWFSDQMPDLGSKDSMVQVQGKWVIELAELDSLNRGEVSRVKAFMSAQIDRFRPPYGKRASDHPRQCVFAGSTNLDDYLRDETGGRRFWPVRCGARIDVAGIERDRAQLWAEAVHRFKQGEAWWLDRLKLNQQAEAEQAARYQGDPWDETVASFVKPLEEVTVAQILRDAIGMEKERWSKREANRIGAILRSLGWRKGRSGTPDPATGKRPPAFLRPSPSPSAHKDGDGDGDATKPNDFNDMSPTSSTSPSSQEFPGRKPEKSSGPDFPRTAEGKMGGDGDVGDVGDILLKREGNCASPTTSPCPPGHNGAGLGDASPKGNGHPGRAESFDEMMERLRAMGYARPAPEADDDDADAEERAAIQEFDGEGAAKPAIEVFEV